MKPIVWGIFGLLALKVGYSLWLRRSEIKENILLYSDLYESQKEYKKCKKKTEKKIS